MIMDPKLHLRVERVFFQMYPTPSLTTSVNSEAIVHALRNLFPEYARMKLQVLRRSVDHHLGTITSRYFAEKPIEMAPVIHINDLDSIAEEPVNKNLMNSSLTQMYKTKTEGGKDSEKSAGESPANTPKRRRLLRREYSDGFDSMRSETERKDDIQPAPTPTITIHDIGGVDRVVDDIKQLVIWPLTHPEVYKSLGVKAVKGILLHGPPGCGKSRLAHAIAGTLAAPHDPSFLELSAWREEEESATATPMDATSDTNENPARSSSEPVVPWFCISGPEIVGGRSGESEERLRRLFEAAKANEPCLVFIDEIDSICGKRESAQREMEKRIVAQLLTCIDSLDSSFVVVVAATNRPDAIDPALRRGGRFDREIAIGIPDERARLAILEVMTQKMRLSPCVSLEAIARTTPGFVGADLGSVCSEAALCAITKVFKFHSEKGKSPEGTEDAFLSADDLRHFSVEMTDFQTAITKVQPSAKREGFATIPDVSWSNVGALDDVRLKLEKLICKPMRTHHIYKHMGVKLPAGMLLFGPPGCGKTLLAKAVAAESGANFISVRGPELLNKYVGESEKGVRQVFSRARASAPCVIFFDELDSLVPERSKEGNSSSERVVNQMLTELEGFQDQALVFVIAATNRPDIIDTAMLRPGRLDERIFVPLPSETGRVQILRALTRKMPLAADVDLEWLGKNTQHFSGADLSLLVREAAMDTIEMLPDAAIKDIKETTMNLIAVSRKDFEGALSRVSNSVSEEQMAIFEKLRHKFCKESFA
eukprot:Platyproteum_vivax@DN15955_c0_g1_i1.p1